MAETPHVRDLRIDLFRGLALVMIFINHMPGTIWENFTSRNFGFSDGAEGFVLMSGIATGLAYGTVFLRGAPDWAQALRPWRRALTLWWVHVVVVLCILALFLATWHDPAVANMAEKRNIILVLQDPVFIRDRIGYLQDCVPAAFAQQQLKVRGLSELRF